MEHKRIALLDADFTVKTIMSQKDSTHNLLNLMMQHSEYEFVCHEKTIKEIKDHDFCGAYNFVIGKVNSGIIHVYSDKEIIEILSSIYGKGAIAQYIKLLKNSCDAFGRAKYKDYYSKIDSLSSEVKEAEFLEKLFDFDNFFGRGKGLGEIKLLILLQTLNIIHPGDVSVFCSDDSGARFGVFSTASVHCISVVTLFFHLKSWGLKKEEIEPYYVSFESGLSADQKTFKVYSKSNSNRISIPCREVFDNIFADKYEAYGTGYLKEK